MYPELEKDTMSGILEKKFHKKVSNDAGQRRPHFAQSLTWSITFVTDDEDTSPSLVHKVCRYGNLNQVEY